MKCPRIFLLISLIMSSASATLDIKNYEGKKLLLCGGQASPNTGDNTGWYTVDNQGSLNPDYIGDLLQDRSYIYLSQKKFDMISEENCDYRVTQKVHENSVQLLNKGGFFISRICFPEGTPLHEIKEMILKPGFSQVYLTNLERLKNKTELKE
ncbi:MAG TPA: hypothetical protein VNJ29_01600, partial [Candidatus Nitrosotenuis sp.]|nr:hypothetical protein [Candidatus Nitrosotenuis sp.]